MKNPKKVENLERDGLSSGERLKELSENAMTANAPIELKSDVTPKEKAQRNDQKEISDSYIGVVKYIESSGLIGLKEKKQYSLIVIIYIVQKYGGSDVFHLSIHQFDLLI